MNYVFYDFETTGRSSTWDQIIQVGAVLVNDTFDIYGIEYYPNASVFIYDRWGVKKFESKNNIYVPWDGYTDGVENEIGTYYYVIELNTGQKNYSGSITLKR